MGREAKATFEQVAAAADALQADHIGPSTRNVRERLGNVGSMGTINRHLQEWNSKRERAIAQPLAVSSSLQRAMLDFTREELGKATLQLKMALAEQRQEINDLALEVERQSEDIKEHLDSETTLHAEASILRGRLTQMEEELEHSRDETVAERERAGQARIDLATAMSRLEAMPRLEADLAALRKELQSEREHRIAATQQAAVLEAQLDAARERAVQVETHNAEVRAASANVSTSGPASA